VSSPLQAQSSPSSTQSRSERSLHDVVEIAIRLGMLALLVGWCLRIVAPFAGIVIWGLIITIASEGLFERLRRLLAGRSGIAATVFVVLSLCVVFVPMILLSETLVTGAQRFAQEVRSGRLSLPAPSAEVAEWPLVGPRLYASWELARTNLEEVLTRLGPQLRAVSGWLLHAAGQAGVGILELVASLVIAGLMLARIESTRATLQRFAVRLAGLDRGRELVEIGRTTIKGVVQGIIGVALIQALLAGLAFSIADIPAAGVWSLLVLVFAIVQIPVTLAVLPPIALAFSMLSTPFAIAFTVWCVVVALLDNVLKPLLFGRGAQVPTLVVFLGAIGGMLAMGIVGLFLGAVVLAVGYQLLNAWLAEADPHASHTGERLSRP
jgi:predicted PurR-regulated permease PerM